MRKLSLLIGFIFMAMACEKAFLPKNPANTPQSNFDLMWETLDRKYAYFELKNLDWDSVYQAFDPRVHNGMSDEELFAVMDSMLYLLRDGHVNLTSDFNVSRNWQWYLGYPDNFNYQFVERHYLGQDHRIAGGLSYTILEDSIGYIYYGSFSSGFSADNLTAALNYLKNTKGIIIDIRNNGGGSVNQAYALAQRFVPQPQEFLVRLLKTGPEPNQFETGVTLSLGPSSNANYLKPVALLTNRRCYSAANTFVAIMSQLPQVTIIGDTTGGGGGLPIDSELPNGWRYRFSATRELTPQGHDLELGMPPDIDLDIDSTDLSQGRDNIIESALSKLR